MLYGFPIPAKQPQAWSQNSVTLLLRGLSCLWTFITYPAL